MEPGLGEGKGLATNNEACTEATQEKRVMESESVSPPWRRQGHLLLEETAGWGPDGVMGAHPRKSMSCRIPGGADGL